MTKVGCVILPSLSDHLVLIYHLDVLITHVLKNSHPNHNKLNEEHDHQKEAKEESNEGSLALILLRLRLLISLLTVVLR